MPNPALTPKRPEYYIQTGSMFENPYGVPWDEVIRFILENPAEVVAQVVFGKYVESSGLVFSGELIQNMIDRSKTKVMGDQWVDKEALAEAQTFWATYGNFEWQNRWHTGIDLARKTDYTVIKTLDTRVTPARLVYFKRLNRVPWETIYSEIGRARAHWGGNILYDSTGMAGDVIGDALEERSYCARHHRTLVADARCTDGMGGALDCRQEDYLPLSCCTGYSFQTASKVQLIEHLREKMSSGYRMGENVPFGAIRMPPIVQTEEEMSFYIWDDKRITTDCLMALALAVWHALQDNPGSVIAGSPFGR